MKTGGTYHVKLAVNREFTVHVAHRSNVAEVCVQDGETRRTFTLQASAEHGRVMIDDHPIWVDRRGGEGLDRELVIDGNRYRVRIESDVDRRIRRLRPTLASATAPREVRMPMPGLVVAIQVTNGDAIEPGDGLAIVEAMKMENEIDAPIAGTVADVSIVAGQAVEQGALLCRIIPNGGGA